VGNVGELFKILPSNFYLCDNQRMHLSLHTHGYYDVNVCTEPDEHKDEEPTGPLSKSVPTKAIE